jgi:hypothetical protein
MTRGNAGPRGQAKEGDREKVIAALASEVPAEVQGREHARETELLWVRMAAHDKPQDRA